MRLYDEHVTNWDGVVEWFERNGYEEAPEVGENAYKCEGGDYVYINVIEEDGAYRIQMDGRDQI